MKGWQKNCMNNILKNDGCVIEIPGGRLTESCEGCTLYNLRALDKYCEERNVLPKYLTDEERNQFIIKEKS